MCFLLFNKTDHPYLLTPWSRILPEKLKRPKLLKKFPALYGTRRFITTFTRARHLSLSWATLIQSMPPIQPLKDPFWSSIKNSKRSNRNIFKEKQWITTGIIYMFYTVHCSIIANENQQNAQMIHIFSICSTYMFQSCLTIIRVCCGRVSNTTICAYHMIW
jgi:hypothetical protein